MSSQSSGVFGPVSIDGASMELEGALDLLRLDRPEAPQPWTYRVTFTPSEGMCCAVEGQRVTGRSLSFARTPSAAQVVDFRRYSIVVSFDQKCPLASFG